MERRVGLDLPSRPESAAALTAALGDLLRGRAVDEALARGVGVALGEAFANAVEHGNGGDPSRHVAVDLRLDGDRLVVAVVDEGDGFDPALIADPATAEGQRSPRGRGLLLMSELMEEVTYERHPARRGCVVTLTTTLRGPSSSEEAR